MLTLAAITLILAADADRPTSANDLLTELQGQWELVASFSREIRLDRPGSQKAVTAIKGNQISSPGVEEQRTITVTEIGNHKAIDIPGHTRGFRGGMVYEGIYHLEDRLLTIYMSDYKKPRPTKLSVEMDGGGRYKTILRRVTEEPRE